MSHVKLSLKLMFFSPFHGLVQQIFQRRPSKISCWIGTSYLSQFQKKSCHKSQKLLDKKWWKFSKTEGKAIATIMKDFTAKDQIFLLDRMIWNLWLFLDRTSLWMETADCQNFVHYIWSTEFCPCRTVKELYHASQ